MRFKGDLNIQRTWRWLPLLLLVVVVAGCARTTFGDLVVPAPEPPGSSDASDGADPSGDGNDPPGASVGTDPLFLGRVVFANTSLGMRATVAFREPAASALTSSDGNFDVNMPRGVHPYVLESLLGTYTGEAIHDGRGRKVLSVPAFEGWSEAYFDELLTAPRTPYTTRWTDGTTIPVWIESYHENHRVTPQAVDAAWSAFEEWQSILGHTIIFVETTDRAEAAQKGIVVHFDTQANVAREAALPGSNVIGVCKAWYMTGRSLGALLRGEIWIAYGRQQSSGLHRHEIGHCIGLNHSPDLSDVMYPTITEPQKTMTAREKHMAQLLYSIPPGTPAFGIGARAPMADFHPHGPVYIDDSDGTVLRIIPTYVEESL